MKIIKYFINQFLFIFYLIAKILGIKLSRKVFSTLFLNLAPFFKSKNVIEKI